MDWRTTLDQHFSNPCYDPKPTVEEQLTAHLSMLQHGIQHDEAINAQYEIRDGIVGFIGGMASGDPPRLFIPLIDIETILGVKSPPWISAEEFLNQYFHNF
jgi:hypothetical protein